MDARTSGRRARLESTSTEAHGTCLHAYVGGDGAPVVLVHGFGVSSTYMLPLALALTPALSVYAVDLPGHGKSGTLRCPASIASFADALGHWIEAVGLLRPVLVANSMGCQVVTELAVRRPGNAGPLVLIGPTVDPRRRSARHQLLSALRDVGHEPISLVAHVAGDDRLTRLATLVPLARSALVDPIEERLPRVEQPTTIVRGSDDGFVGDAWVRRAARLLPNGRLVVVDGEAHAVHYTRPRLVAAIVREAVRNEWWTIDERVGTLAG